MRMEPIHCTHQILPGLFVFCLRHKQKKTTVLSNWSARHSVKYFFAFTLKSLKDKTRRQQNIRGVKGRYNIYVSLYDLSDSKECRDEKILHKVRKVERKNSSDFSLQTKKWLRGCGMKQKNASQKSYWSLRGTKTPGYSNSAYQEQQFPYRRLEK